MRLREAKANAAAATGPTGTCQVCGRTVTLRQDGQPQRTHKRHIDHGNGDVAYVECRGSRRPPVEYRDELRKQLQAVTGGGSPATGTPPPAQI